MKDEDNNEDIVIAKDIFKSVCNDFSQKMDALVRENILAYLEEFSDRSEEVDVNATIATAMLYSMSRTLSFVVSAFHEDDHFNAVRAAFMRNVHQLIDDSRADYLARSVDKESEAPNDDGATRH